MSKDPFAKLKEIKQNDVPKQKVVPVKERKRDSEQSYTLWLDKELIKALKVRALEEDTNVKNLVEEAIRQYLK
ncbi:ribbon-helix-helix protein, CopG family [Sphingobacterium phlebotomi]|uniref:Ribbon-helix-helix protein, CopG family n=1 Tax=Sphingobacterium phlebotomi TaxID=2605433 RepID=A0A5D4GWB2_9SPHI|nr:ribbon-helix-helix protein, CopG family [Sphingobacterium phlebotomi]TYR30810.1 ribbon-helix-helix protein, CopG family [Sphingobacterium phlebotomi]